MNSKTATGFFIWVVLVLLLQPAGAQILEFHQQDTSDAKKMLPRYSGMSIKLAYGGHVPSDVKVLTESIELNPFLATQIRLGWKTYGNKRWQQLFNYPSYGFGLYHATFIPKDNVLGNPSAVFGFFNSAFKRWNTSALNYEVGLGVSYNFLGYDPESNPEQVAIGSDVNVYFDIGMEYAFLLSNRFDMALGFNFTHFSNGRTRTPNKGINLIALNAGLKYPLSPYIKGQGRQTDLAYRPTSYIRHTLPTFKGFWEYYFNVNGAVTTSTTDIEDRELSYGAGSLSLDIARHISYTSKLTVGFDYFFDASLQEEYADEYGGKQNVPKNLLSYPGIHFGYELMAHRFTLCLHYGIPLEDVKNRGNWYARVGLRYDISKHLFARIALKTPGGTKADFIEWGVGTYFYSKKSYPTM